MRLLPAICCLVFIIVVGKTPATASEESPARPTIWRLDETAQVGGHPATVFGAPRVVAGPDGKAVYFDGIADGLLLPVNPVEGFAQFTIEVLLAPSPDGLEEQRFLHLQDKIGSRALIEIRLKDGNWALDTFLRHEPTLASRTLLDRAKVHPAGNWAWVALVYAGGRMAHFVNGVKELEGTADFPPLGPGKISLGMRQNQVYWFKGGIREVRFHPTALPSDALQQIASK